MLPYFAHILTRYWYEGDTLIRKVPRLNRYQLKFAQNEPDLLYNHVVIDDLAFTKMDLLWFPLGESAVLKSSFHFRTHTHCSSLVGGPLDLAIFGSTKCN